MQKPQSLSFRCKAPPKREGAPFAWLVIAAITAWIVYALTLGWVVGGQ